MELCTIAIIILVLAVIVLVEHYILKINKHQFLSSRLRQLTQNQTQI